MNVIASLPVDLNGQPYTPIKPRPWLTEKTRADFAEIFDCAGGEVEFRLDVRDAMNARIDERREYDDPMGYEAGRDRGLASMRTSYGRL